VIWIPDFFDFTHKHWLSARSLGFDQVYLQANYFIDSTTSVSRLDSAVALVRAEGVRLEVEFNKRMFSSGTFAERLDPYLGMLRKSPDLRDGPLALYEGSGALPRLARSQDSMLSRLYRDFAETFRVPAASGACQ
jgi:hypothetical protein